MRCGRIRAIFHFQRGDLRRFSAKKLPGSVRSFLAQYPDAQWRIPMWNEARSLNLAVASGIVVYEGLRQLRLF